MAPLEKTEDLYDCNNIKSDNIDVATTTTVDSDASNYNDNELNDEKIAGSSSEDFWTKTEKVFLELEEEMFAGNNVTLIKEEETEESLVLQFELCGLKPEDLKVSMAHSNFLEVEQVADESKDYPRSYIWAFPIGGGYKNSDLQFEFTADAKLVVTLPKDLDFKLDEKIEDVDEFLTPCLFPESDVQAEEIPVEVISPIEAGIDEDEDGFKVEMKVDQFEVDKISVNLTDRHLLRVEGEKQKSGYENSEDPEMKISRKSFGRMFWIPDGCCDTDAIEATATKEEDSSLNLKILIPKLKTGLEHVLAHEKGTKSIPIKKL